MVNRRISADPKRRVLELGEAEWHRQTFYTMLHCITSRFLSMEISCLTQRSLQVGVWNQALRLHLPSESLADNQDTKTLTPGVDADDGCGILIATDGSDI